MRWWLVVGWIGCKDTEPPVAGDTGEPPPEPTYSLSYVQNLRWEPLPDGIADFEPPKGQDLVDLASSLVLARWTMTAPGTVHFEVSVDKDVWVASPTRTLQPGEHTQVVAGVPFESTAQWRIVMEDTGEELFAKPITTPLWPIQLPRPVVTVNDPKGQLAGGRYLLTSMNQFDGGWTGGSYWTILLDRQGRLMWARRTPGKAWTLFAQVAVTGDRILWDEQTYWSSFLEEGLESKVHSTYLDEEIEVIPTPGLHHAFIQLPDGTLVWGSQCHGGGEALVELRPDDVIPPEPLVECPNSGVGHVIWTCVDDWTTTAGCESNGLFYAESTDSFLYSFYTNSSIVEVDHQTGDSLWWAGDQSGGYDFIPGNAKFSWQHGVSYTDTGTLLVSSEWGPFTNVETWLLEYEVDRKAGELSLVWSNNSNVRAYTNGQAWRLANGNTLHIVGSAAVAREVTVDGIDVWRIEYDDDYLLGQGEFVDDLYRLVKPPVD